jgi:hypothetical protein
MPIFCDSHCGAAKMSVIANTMPARAKRNKYLINERVMSLKSR